MTDNERIEAIRQRIAAATPGPWRIRDLVFDAHVATEDGTPIAYPPKGNSPRRGDADLIANAPADLAWLIEKLEACDLNSAQPGWRPT